MVHEGEPLLLLSPSRGTSLFDRGIFGVFLDQFVQSMCESMLATVDCMSIGMPIGIWFILKIASRILHFNLLLIVDYV